MTLFKEHGKERNGTRLCSWPLVPFLCEKKSGSVQAEPWTSPAESARAVSFAHDTTPTRCCAQSCVHLHQTRRHCSRSVGPLGPPPKQEKGVQHFFLMQDVSSFFLRCTESNRFPITNHHPFLRKIVFHSGSSNALAGGSRYAPRKARLFGGIPFVFFAQSNITCVYLE